MTDDVIADDVMAGDVDAMQERLAALRMDYGVKLLDRIGLLAEQLEALSHATGYKQRLSTLQTVRRLTHKLAGSGATFGFPKVSETARVMEMECHDIVDRKTDIAGDFLERQFVLCKRLREAAEAPALAVLDDGLDVFRAPKTGLQGQNIKTILILETQSEITDQVRMEMEHYGFAVRVISHPSKLEAALARGDVDVLVSGLVFDGDRTTALEELARLREKGVLNVPLVIRSILDDMEARLGAVRVGAEAFFPKPVAVTDLMDKLEGLSARTQDGPFRILIIDDDESIARYTELVLQGAGMHTRIQTSPVGVLETLEDFSPELVLLDLYMPHCSGQEIAAVIRQCREFTGIPIVFLSGEADTQVQLSAMELGGDDFLTKPIRPAHLISSLRIRAARFRELRSFMVRDCMTSLFNHTTTKQLLDTEVSRAQREQIPLALVSLDLDKFKTVNDLYGHAEGDRVIKTLARLLRQRLRGADIIGRMGGEEFAAILPGSDAAEAEILFDKIRKAFADIVFQAYDETQFSVTFSCGIAAFPHFTTATALSDNADKALYSAKNGGRNKVVQAD